MRLIRAMRDRRIRGSFKSMEELYRDSHPSGDVRRLQLERFNDLWQRVSEDSPFYAALTRESNLPRRFDSWEEFSNSIPTTSRSDLKVNVDRIALAHARPDYWRISGGTSAEPLRLPAWRHEDWSTAHNTWYARNWYGAGAADRLALLWGHSHLLGDGLSGRIGAAERRLKDFSLGYLRISAYDLSEEKLREAGQRLLHFRPGYVLGYATALHRFAVFNEDRRSELRNLNLKVVIATGESFPSEESARLISAVFGCPVAMEYGAVETGAVAHQRPSGEFQVFWGSYYIEGLSSAEFPDSSELVVTALYPRLTPLIRYRIGDLVSGSIRNRDIGMSFDRVIGRCNDGIHLGETGFVHSESFSHVLRDIVEVDAFQVVQNAARDITIAYVSKHPLPERTENLLRTRLRKVDPRLCDTSFEQVSNLSRTVAGKTRRIISKVSTTP